MELGSIRDQENRAAEAEKQELEAQGKQLEAEKAALIVEKEALATDMKAIEAELETLTAKKLQWRLSLTRPRPNLRGEAANSWGLGKEEFLKSSEFDDLCAKRSLTYFESDFKSCVAQLRANGYSEEEHPAPFLSVSRALEELSDDEEEADD
ncbi:hypothetical protein F511_26996 [Dorcoceras hygrometricum]|uniref:Uncharacterized protein n=1 Tax=Dorcoceras hygrometricum TaxID=472368 RepID=A0A2Z7B7H9_9LAMI|nr:hypothetical protein F511_26996 [Dorcoceras hygrometricum]